MESYSQKHESPANKKESHGKQHRPLNMLRAAVIAIPALFATPAFAEDKSGTDEHEPTRIESVTSQESHEALANDIYDALIAAGFEVKTPKEAAQEWGGYETVHIYYTTELMKAFDEYKQVSKELARAIYFLRQEGKDEPELVTRLLSTDQAARLLEAKTKKYAEKYAEGDLYEPHPIVRRELDRLNQTR